MDWNRVEGNWKQLKGKIKEQWGKLTDDDLDAIEGRREHSKARFKSVMVMRRIRSAGRSMTGTTRNDGEPWKAGDVTFSR
jgi:uncharacterized protein YjbJ (UPF0337 family)